MMASARLVFNGTQRGPARSFGGSGIEKALVAFLLVVGLVMTGPALAQSRPDAAIEREVPAGQGQIQLSFAPVAAAAGPAVVNVYAIRATTQRSPLLNDPFFQRFFGQRQPSRRLSQSLGSGVIISAEGLVLTNNHVIDGATDINITTAQGRAFKTEILLTDPETDLAVLKIIDPAGRRFSFLEFADSDELQVGDLVLAIGNPFGVGQTVTSGIVSALARSGVGVSDFQSFIQTDAAINPGNSGGALVDMSGRLVGINTAIFSRSGGSNGIGFAIPANLVRVVAEAGASGGPLERPWIGARLQDVSSDIADSLGMEYPNGAMVATVLEGSAGARAGLRPGDVILEVNGRPIEDEGAFGYRMATLSVGGVAVFRVLRQGRVMELTVELEAQPPGVDTGTITIAGTTRFSGVEAATLTPYLAQRYEVSGQGGGVLILNVERGSPAEQFGLKVGDILLRLNGIKLDSAGLFEQVALSGARRWEIEMRRGRRIIRSFTRG
jgi:Do/DeqQ family serine protease